MNDTILMTTAAAAIVAGTPLLLAGLGELLAERSGVLNLGVEGMMLVGAIAGFAAVHALPSPWIGLLAAALAGGLFSLIHAFVAVTLGLNQIVSGLALVILGTGISSFLGNLGETPFVGQPARASFTRVDTGALADLPVVGPILFNQDPIVYASWVAVAAVALYLRRTRPGMHLQAVGDDPATADAMGIGVSRYRYAHVAAGGVFAGVAGAHIAIAINPSWIDGITAGQGWIAIALVIFAGWRPLPLLLAAYFFGALRRLGFTLQAADLAVVSPQLLAMIPFVAAALLLIAFSSGRARRRLGAPRALAEPYSRELRV